MSIDVSCTFTSAVACYTHYQRLPNTSAYTFNAGSGWRYLLSRKSNWSTRLITHASYCRRQLIDAVLVSVIRIGHKRRATVIPEMPLTQLLPAFFLSSFSESTHTICPCVLAFDVPQGTQSSAQCCHTYSNCCLCRMHFKMETDMRGGGGRHGVRPSGYGGMPHGMFYATSMSGNPSLFGFGGGPRYSSCCHA